MRSVLIRVAKAANRVIGRRGRVFAERFHAVRIRAPRQARACIAYVLNNARKHGLGRRSGPDAIDPWRRHGEIHPGEVPGRGEMRWSLIGG